MKNFKLPISLFIFFLTIGQTVYGAEKAMTPKEALEKMMEGNQRFVNDKIVCPDRTSERRLALASKQKPFAVILGCSDSRTPPEIIFDQGIGDLFVVRVAGNIVGDIEMESIVYSVDHNHSCLIVVLGHENCGAVTAVMQHQAQDVPAIAKLIETATAGLKNSTLNEAIIANVRHTVNELRKAVAFKDLIKNGKLDIVGGYYHFTTGEVDILKN